MEKQNFFKKHSSLLRSLTFIIGTGLILVAGLLFVILVDLKVKINTNKDTIFISAWLFFSMIFAVGGGLFYFAGDAVKHKHVRTLIFKGVGFVLSALHIMFLQAFHAKVNGMLGVSKIALAQANSAYTISLIITIAALVVLAINYVLSIIFIQEDY